VEVGAGTGVDGLKAAERDDDAGACETIHRCLFNTTDRNRASPRQTAEQPRRLVVRDWGSEGSLVFGSSIAGISRGRRTRETRLRRIVAEALPHLALLQLGRERSALLDSRQLGVLREPTSAAEARLDDVRTDKTAHRLRLQKLIPSDREANHGNRTQSIILSPDFRSAHLGKAGRPRATHLRQPEHTKETLRRPFSAT
jgi:hypothetical protein